MPLLPSQKRRIFTKYGISIPGVDYALNPRRNITVTIPDDPPVVSPIKKQDQEPVNPSGSKVKPSGSRVSEDKKPTGSRFSDATPEKKKSDHGKLIMVWCLGGTGVLIVGFEGVTDQLLIC